MAAIVSKRLKTSQGNDYATALRTWLTLVEAGKRDTQFFVRGLYRSGASVPDDQVRAHGGTIPRFMPAAGLLSLLRSS
jgi:hypothetical protein